MQLTVCEDLAVRLSRPSWAPLETTNSPLVAAIRSQARWVDAARRQGSVCPSHQPTRATDVRRLLHLKGVWMIHIVDYTGEVHDSVRHALAILDALETLVTSGKFRPPQGDPQRDALLLRALREVYRLRRVARLEAPPLLPPGVRFYAAGPRRLDQPSEGLIVRSTANPAADYRPWLQGKLANVERCVYELCELTDGLGAGAAAAPGDSHEATYDARRRMVMASARVSLQDLTDLIEAGLLKIQAVARTS